MWIGTLVVSTLLAGVPNQVGVFEDKGSLFVRAGSNKGLKVGVEVQLLGDKIGDTEERRVIGTAVVMEIWDTIARVVPDDDAKKLKPQAARLVSAAPGSAVRGSGPAPAQPSRAAVKGSTESFGFSDHLIGQCSGLQVDVYGHSTLTGGLITLVVDGAHADQKETLITGPIFLNGIGRGMPVMLRVSQGLVGTNYLLRVDDKPCELVNQ